MIITDHEDRYIVYPSRLEPDFDLSDYRYNFSYLSMQELFRHLYRYAKEDDVGIEYYYRLYSNDYLDKHSYRVVLPSEMM